MKSINPCVWITAAIIAWTPCLASANGADEAAIQAIERFHTALKEGKVADASALLAPEAVIYESGYAESRADYMAHHLAADIAFAQATQRIVKSSSQLCDASLCVVMQTSETTGKYQGKNVRSKGVETTVLRRDGGGWTIHHVHWSSHK